MTKQFHGTEVVHGEHVAEGVCAPTGDAAVLLVGEDIEPRVEVGHVEGGTEVEDAY